MEAPLAEGRIAAHTLPRAEALVTTLFVRRRDAFVSTALKRFLDYTRRFGADASRARKASPHKTG